jgi:hypothetical protein
MIAFLPGNIDSEKIRCIRTTAPTSSIERFFDRHRLIPKPVILLDKLRIFLGI